MNDSERLLLFLAGGDPDGLLHTVRAAKSPSLLQYARGWLTLVAQEFRVELQEALLSGPRGKTAQWVATAVEPVDGACLMTLKAPAALRAHDEELGAPPPTLHRLLYCQPSGILIFVSAVLASEDGTPRVRCLLIEADSLHGEGRRAGTQLAKASPGTSYKCVEALSGHLALARCRALCGLDKLAGPLRAAIVPGDTAPSSESTTDWLDMPAGGGGGGGGSSNGTAGPLARLSPSQLEALAGVRGAVGLVHGVFGAGDVAVLAAACACRVPHKKDAQGGAGALALATAATAQTVDAIVAALEAAGVTEMLAVAPSGSGRAPAGAATAATAALGDAATVGSARNRLRSSRW